MSNFCSLNEVRLLDPVTTGLIMKCISLGNKWWYDRMLEIDNEIRYLLGVDLLSIELSNP